MTADTFQNRLCDAARLAEEAIEAALPDTGRIAEAMRYATRGGKGLRAFLVVEGAGLFGVEPGLAAPAAGAIEAIHGYSLIHDDLPAMDDDALRRGQPTVHVAFDEATAILAGDALQSLAFQMLATAPYDAEIRLTLIRNLAKDAGVAGMVGGQAMDIAAETAPEPLDLDRITALQAGKTGALFRWAATAGAVIADEDPAPLRTFAQNFGLAFQIADDLLDAKGDEGKAGKRLQKDAAAGKATFVSLLGEEGARARAADLISEAKDSLKSFGRDARFLNEAADFVLARDR